MVLAGKVFVVAEPTGLGELKETLDGFKLEEEREEDGQVFTLVREVRDLAEREGALLGIYAEDFLTRLFHRGKPVLVPRTMEALFCFAEHGRRIFLIVLEKKRRANLVANRLSEAIFGRIGAIVEARIPPEALEEFHKRNPEETKVIFFDNVDIPNVNKLALYGPDLVNTELFEQYKAHGDIWYVVSKASGYDYVVGITRDASVTIFNMDDRLRYLDYVLREVLPMIA